MRKISFISLLFFFAFITVPYAEDIPVSLDIKALLETVKDITREKYPDADDVLVDDYLHTTYQENGKSVTFDDQAFKILTEPGKNSNRTITLHFNESYGKAEVLLAEIYKPDGRVVKVDIEKQTKVMVDRSQMSSNIYDPNQKVITTTIPDLEVGDTLRFVTRHETIKPRVPNTFSDYHTFESTQPVIRYVIEVVAPKSLPLKHRIIKDRVEKTVAYTEKDLGDHISHKWTATNVPQAFPEPRMPAMYTVVQRLLLSTIPTWNDVSKWYWNLCLPHLKASPAMEAKVAELTKDAKTQDEKLRAIFRFVSQEIRYMGITIEKDAPGYEPHDVTLTFENRHGVCRDKAALLVSMLRVAGFQAFPVLINAGPLKDPEVPQPYFNHAVTAILNDDGSYLLMDSTDENTKQLFPAYLNNMSYLVARPEGDTLRTTPFSPAKDNMLVIDATGEIKRDGSFEATAKISFDGINDNSYRGAFSTYTPQQQRQFFERIVKYVAPGAVLKTFEISPKDMMDTEQPLQATLTINTPANLFVHSGDNAMLEIPQFGYSVGIINFILSATGLEKRKYPLKTNIACGVEEHFSIKVAPEWGLPAALPSFNDINQAPFFWTKKLTFNPQDRILKLDKFFAIDAVQFTPEQYTQLKGYLKAIEVNDRKMAIFNCATQTTTASHSDEADIEFINHDINIKLSDEHNWTLTETVTKKILTYNGKKSNAELKISYNPVWETVELNYARVTTPAKEKDQKPVVKEISEQEKNTMDESWVASAPRYPAGKTLVASLPAVEIGSTIEYQITTTYKNQPFFSFSTSFRGSNPIAKRQVTISAPNHINLQTAVYQNGFLASDKDAHNNNITESVKKENDSTIWTWTAVNQEMIAKESGLPPARAYLPSIQTSTGSWVPYMDKISKALAAKTVTSPVLKKVADQIRTKSPDNLVKGARDYVAQSIRTAGPNFLNLPLDCLSTPDVTITQGYGHDADKAILLSALLKELGFNAEFILAGGPLHPQIFQNAIDHPTPRLFSVLLLRLKIDDKTIWLNDQNQYAELGTTSFDKFHAMQMDGRPFIITPDTQFANKSRTDITIQLQDDGSAIYTQTAEFHAEPFTSVKKFYTEITPEDRRRHIQETVADISQSATLEGDFVTDFDIYPGKRTFTCKIKDFAVIDNDYYYFNLPCESFSGTLGTTTDERKNPLFWSGYTEKHFSINVILPPSYRNVVLTPKDVNWTQPSGKGGMVFRMSVNPDKSLKFSYHVNLKPDVISKEQYQRLRELNQTLLHAAMSTVLLKK
ncbi:MAG: DUF3857 domain-containing protein [Victivallales bacterium]|nr:DUF3857 domain-containing protein [Victivallales bacterium]